MRKIIFILLFVALLPFFMGCGLLERVPDKQFTDIGHSQEQGDMLDIDGVIYRTQPMTQWRPIDFFDATLIGTVEGTKYYVYTFDKDEKKVF